MKRISCYIIALFLTVTLAVRAQSPTMVQEEIEQIMEVPGMKVIYLSPSMLKMTSVESLSIDGNPALKSVLRQITSMYIISGEGEANARRLRKSFSFLSDKKNKHLEELMIAKEKENVVRLLAHLEGDRVYNLFLVVSDPKEYSVIILGGDFKRQELEKMFDKEQWNKRKE